MSKQQRAPDIDRRKNNEETKNVLSINQQLHAVEPLLVIDNLCTFFEVSKKAIYHQVETKGLPAFKIAGKLRFRMSEVLEWLEELRVPNHQPENLVGSTKEKRYRELGSQSEPGWKENQAHIPDPNQDGSEEVRDGAGPEARRLVDIEKLIRKAG
jgi:predicted DNA-binding transcriptional regulator AlpA